MNLKKNVYSCIGNVNGPTHLKKAKKKNFHDSIRTWFKLEELHGPEILKYGNNINWIPDEKLEIVSKVLAGNSIKSIA